MSSIRIYLTPVKELFNADILIGVGIWIHRYLIVIGDGYLSRWGKSRRSFCAIAQKEPYNP